MATAVVEASAELRKAAQAFADAAERVLAERGTAQIGNDDLARALTAAIKLYAATSEAEDAFPPPVSAEHVTPTEVAMVVSEMLRAVDISLFDLAMWYRRGRPEGGRP
jgi:hypothetical protein